MSVFVLFLRHYILGKREYFPKRYPREEVFFFFNSSIRLLVSSLGKTKLNKVFHSKVTHGKLCQEFGYLLANWISERVS